MDRKPTASPEAPPDCMYSRCGCCHKVEKLTAEIEQWRSLGHELTEHDDAGCQKCRYHADIAKDLLTTKDSGQ